MYVVLSDCLLSAGKLQNALRLRGSVIPLNEVGNKLRVVLDMLTEVAHQDVCIAFDIRWILSDGTANRAPVKFRRPLLPTYPILMSLSGKRLCHHSKHPFFLFINCDCDVTRYAADSLCVPA